MRRSCACAPAGRADKADVAITRIATRECLRTRGYCNVRAVGAASSFRTNEKAARGRGLVASFRRSDAHRHHDVAVLEVTRLFRTHLAGRLRVLELESDFAARRRFQEIQQVAGVEADGDGLAVVAGLE